MPVKWNAIKTATPTENWRTQILSAYGGEHESIFVVESADDPAANIIKTLQGELEGKAVVKLVVAGNSVTCTQKIHNMLAGVDACSDSVQYVFFMDANSQMHPGTVAVLFNELDMDPNVLAATGYPLDVPPPDASVWAWVMCQFRYNCMSEFSSSRSDFIWGGAMLMRKSDIDDDVCEVKTRWLDGGYSDDMLVQACAADHGRAIATPLRAVFCNHMKKDVSFCEAWDFLRRQTFVLTTYGSCRNCCKHILLLFLYATFGAFPAYAFYASLPVLVGICIQPTISSVLTVNFFFACGMALLLCITMIVIRMHLRATANLVSSLSPSASPVDVAHAGFSKLLLSFLLQSTLAPFVALCTVKRSIVWGGITYCIKCGKVVDIQRP
jgi:hypothetical protein